MYVSFYEILSACTAPITLVLTMIMQGKRYHAATYFSMLPLMCGVMMCSTRIVASKPKVTTSFHDSGVGQASIKLIKQLEHGTLHFTVAALLSSEALRTDSVELVDEDDRAA